MSLPSKRFSKGSLAASPLRTASPSGSGAEGVQVAILADATGSMASYIDAVREQAKTLLGRLAARHPGIGLACGFYREHTCEEPFRFYGRGGPTRGEFVSATGVAGLQAFLDDAGHTEGNSTSVEALGAGLYYTSRLPWVARHRVLVCVGDHASHGFSDAFVPEWDGDYDSIDLCELGMTHERILRCLKLAKLRCFMVRCGDNADAERQYRDIAARTGGRFVDFQGVEEANDLMVVVEAAIAESTGASARELIERKRREGLISGPSVTALLESFDEK